MQSQRLPTSTLVGHKPLCFPPGHGEMGTNMRTRVCVAIRWPFCSGRAPPRLHHLVKLDADKGGDVVVLALAWAVTSLLCYLLRWLAVLRPGLLPAWPCCLPRVDSGESWEAMAVQKDDFDLRAPQPMCSSSREHSAQLFVTCFPDCYS